MRSPNGFTLIEIVMVLVLLGILAAVAAPKFFDYQEAAEQKAAALSVAEAQARLEAVFSQKLLESSSCSKALEEAAVINTLSDDGSGAFGDFLFAEGSRTLERLNIDVKKNGSETVVLSGYLTLPLCGELAEYLKNTMFDANFLDQVPAAMASSGVNTWQFNSTFTQNTIPAIKQDFQDRSGKSFEELGAQTWAYSSKDRNNPGQGGFFFWTDKAISTNDIDKSIPVIVYDTVKKTYTVAMAKVEQDRTSTGSAVLSLDINSGKQEKVYLDTYEVEAMKTSGHTAEEAFRVFKQLNTQ